MTPSLFAGTFAILVLWLIVDIIWELSRPRDIVMRRLCAWLNLIAWFICLNWINVVAAGLQFYFGYFRHS